MSIFFVTIVIINEMNIIFIGNIIIIITLVKIIIVIIIKIVFKVFWLWHSSIRFGFRNIFGGINFQFTSNSFFGFLGSFSHLIDVKLVDIGPKWTQPWLSFTTL